MFTFLQCAVVSLTGYRFGNSFRCVQLLPCAARQSRCPQNSNPRIMHVLSRNPMRQLNFPRGIASCIIVQGFFFLATTIITQSATFVVTNSLDAGPGSLNQALQDAAASPGVDTITFSNVTGHISTPATSLDQTILKGPGARELTIGGGIAIGAGQAVTISCLRLTRWCTGQWLTFGGIISNAGR